MYYFSTKSPLFNDALIAKTDSITYQCQYKQRGVLHEMFSRKGFLKGVEQMSFKSLHHGCKEDVADFPNDYDSTTHEWFTHFVE